MLQKPFAASAEENKKVILEQLKDILQDTTSVLEIGSGTGQHAVYFARYLTAIDWQPTEIGENLAGLEMWRQEADLDNLAVAFELDVAQEDWRLARKFDAVFTANTLHIMSSSHVEKLFAGLASVLQENGIFCCYGPFNKSGQFSSESNARFDVWLKQRDSNSGIRDLDDLKQYAKKSHLRLIQDIEMPVNNRLLVWGR